MVSSIARSTASGSTAVFSVPFPYLDKTHVQVRLGGVLKTLGVDYTFLTSSTIQITAGNPVAGTVAERRRVTPTDPLTVFSPGNLDSGDLNVAEAQALYVAQEAADNVTDLAASSFVGTPTAQGLPGIGGLVPLPEANKVLGWNEAGDSLENKVVVTLGSIEVIDEDDMHSDSAVKVPVQQSVKAYADNKVAAVSIAQFTGTVDSKIDQAITAAGAQGYVNVPVGSYAATRRNELMAANATGQGVVRVASSGEKLNRRLISKDGIFNYKALWYAHYRMLTAGRLHTVLHGDSTVEGGAWVSHPMYPEDILRNYLLNAGVPAVYVSNFGKGGTTINGLGFTDKTGWVSGTSNPALEPTGTSWLYSQATQQAGTFNPLTFPVFLYKGLVDIVVIKYGINDGSIGSVPTYINGLRAKLAQLRTQFGPLMTIIVVSANVITDTYGTDLGVHNRDEAWVESVLGGERLACLDYQAAHYDAYSAYKARDPDDSYWLDSLASAGPPYRADAGVHPGNAYNSWIWGGLARAIADPGIMSVVSRNVSRWISETNATYSPLKASLPQDFTGFFGKEGVLTAAGSDWLERPGAEITERGPNGIVRQEEWGATSLVGRVRYGYGTNWSSDFIVGTKEAAPTPGAKFVLDASSPARVVQTGRSLVIEGGLNFSGAGNIVTNDILCTTPVGYRPRRQVSILVSFPTVVNIPALWGTNGVITAQPVGGTTAIGGTSYCGLIGAAVGT